MYQSGPCHEICVCYADMLPRLRNAAPATRIPTLRFHAPAPATQIGFQDSEIMPLPRESQPYASISLRLPRRMASKTRKRCPCHENLNLTLKNWGKPHTKPSFIRLESRFRKESGYSFFQTHPTLRTAKIKHKVGEVLRLPGKMRLAKKKARFRARHSPKTKHKVGEVLRLPRKMRVAKKKARFRARHSPKTKHKVGEVLRLPRKMRVAKKKARFRARHPPKTKHKVGKMVRLARKFILHRKGAISHETCKQSKGDISVAPSRTTYEQDFSKCGACHHMSNQQFTKSCPCHKICKQHFSKHE